MNEFVDLHCHMLFDTDDGAVTEQEMYDMLDMAYDDGIRHICLTPHVKPFADGENERYADDAFAKLNVYAKKYADMKLYRGNELFYSHNALDALASGKCLSLNGSRYVLVEFLPNVNFYDFSFALHQLSGGGYLPLVAHAERYACLHKRLALLPELSEKYGVCFQVNCSSLLGDWGFRAKRFAWKALKSGVVAVVASDAHGSVHRKPLMSRSYRLVEKECGHEMARMLFYECPLAILEGKNLFF